MCDYIKCITVYIYKIRLNTAVHERKFENSKHYERAVQFYKKEVCSIYM